MTVIDFILNLNAEKVAEDLFPEYPEDGIGGTIYDSDFLQKQEAAEFGIEIIQYFVKKFDGRNLFDDEVADLIDKCTLPEEKGQG